MRSFVTKLSIFLLLLLCACSGEHTASFSGDDTKPPPCECAEVSCKGITQCDENQYAHCKCDDRGGQCKGKCMPIPKENKDFVVAVLIRITDKKLTQEIIKENKDQYLPIVFSLLSNGSNGHYKVSYRDVLNNFSFTDQAANHLDSGAREFKNL